MSFEDIDTPVSDDVLSGELPDEPVAESAENAEVDTGKQDDSAKAAESESDDKGAKDQADDAQPERAPVIPRARFDEVNAKLHAEREEKEALRAQLEALRQAPDKVDEQAVSINDLERQYLTAVMSGEEDSAIAIRAKINAELQTQAETRATEKMMAQMSAKEEAKAKAADDAKVASVVEQSLAAYQFLDPSSPDANQEAINDVVGWREAYVSQGFGFSDALQKAVAKVAPMYAAVTAKDIPVDTRKQTALSRNASAANAQPPGSVAGVGNRSVPQTPKVETQKDWEKLSASEREAILMGS